MTLVLAIAALWVACGVLASAIASKKGANSSQFLIAGLVSGPFALHAALSLSPADDGYDSDPDSYEDDDVYVDPEPDGHVHDVESLQGGNFAAPAEFPVLPAVNDATGAEVDELSIAELAHSQPDRRSRWDVPVHADAETPAAEDYVEDAVYADEDDDEEEVGYDESPVEKRPGLWSRLFGKKSSPDPDDYYDEDDDGDEEDAGYFDDAQGSGEVDAPAELADDESPVNEYEEEIRVFGIKIFSRVRRSSDRRGAVGAGETTGEEIIEVPAFRPRPEQALLPAGPALVEEEDLHPVEEVAEAEVEWQIEEPEVEEPVVFAPPPPPPVDEEIVFVEPEEIPFEEPVFEEPDEVEPEDQELVEEEPPVELEAVAPTEPVASQVCPHCEEISYPNFYGGCENCGKPLFVGEDPDAGSGGRRLGLRR